MKKSRFTEEKIVHTLKRQEAGEAFAQDIYASWVRPTHEVRLRVNNVYDRAYIKHGSNIKEVGRDFRLQASYLF